VSQFHHNTLLNIESTLGTVDWYDYKSNPNNSEVRDKLERRCPGVSRAHRVQPTYRLAAGKEWFWKRMVCHFRADNFSM